jgi:hypothetical protein
MVNPFHWIKKADDAVLLQEQLTGTNLLLWLPKNWFRNLAFANCANGKFSQPF